MEVVRLIQGEHTIAAVARTPDVVDRTLFGCVKAQREGKLTGTQSKPVTAEQRGISWLRATLARVKMGLCSLRKAAACITRGSI